MAFGPQDMLNTGDKVEPKYSFEPGGIQSIHGPTWFFWVDTEKWAKFSHPVYFDYIDAAHSDPTDGDGIIVKEQRW